MGSKSATHSVTEQEDDVLSYRAISKAAVASMVVGVMSLVAFVVPVIWMFNPMAIVLGLPGIVLGMLALFNIRRFPEELTGKVPAFIGIVVSANVLLFANLLSAYVYATEVPDGYQRVSFRELASDPNKPSESALALNGKVVFIKGFVHPSAGGDRVAEFTLIDDYSICCFGGEPKPAHKILVTLEDGKFTKYDQKVRRVGGKLKVHEVPRFIGDVPLFFELEADYIK